MRGVPVGAEEGEAVNVKLPSNKLQISKPFTISDSVVNFVYDITVVKAGKSNKYILKPQIARSGSDQKFNEVAPEVQLGEPATELQLQLEGDTGLGMEVTIIVTEAGALVEGATVTINGEEVGITGVDGRLSIVLPDTPCEVKIEATLGDKRGALQAALEEHEQQPEWFEGTIIAIHQGEENASPWVMTLEGVEGYVTVYVTELEGTPSVGATARIEGILKNSTIEDGRAEVEAEE